MLFMKFGSIFDTERKCEDATEEESYYILIKQIREPLGKRVVDHQIRVVAETFRLDVTGLSKMTVPELKHWLAVQHITPQHVKLLPDQDLVDVKGEMQQLQVLSLHGCRHGSEHGPFCK